LARAGGARSPAGTTHRRPFPPVLALQPHSNAPIAACLSSPQTPSSTHAPPTRAQDLTLDHAAAWLLPALLGRGTAALPALASLSMDTHGALTVMHQLFEQRGLLARLTRLKVQDWDEMPPLPRAPAPEHCPSGMRMEDLEVDVGEADAAALAAWPMPRLRRLALLSMGPAAMRTLLRAPWAAVLQELSFQGPCEGARRGGTMW
jgi:hypothetical protein